MPYDKRRDFRQGKRRSPSFGQPIIVRRGVGWGSTEDINVAENSEPQQDTVTGNGSHIQSFSEHLEGLLSTLNSEWCYDDIWLKQPSTLKITTIKPKEEYL